MKSEKIVKIASIATSVIGIGLSIATSILDSKKMDMKIAEQVSKHLNKK